MTSPPPVTIRRHGVVTGWRHQTGWRWTCRTCPPIRGRARAGFHHDHRFTDQIRPGRYPDAWTRCVRAALLHIHVRHRAPVDHNQPGNQASLYEEPRTP